MTMKSNVTNTHAFDLDLARPERAELDLFAEELSDDMLAQVAGGGNCVGTAACFGTAGGCLGTASSLGSLTKEE